MGIISKPVGDNEDASKPEGGIAEDISSIPSVIPLFAMAVFMMAAIPHALPLASDEPIISGEKADGYRGIWFTLGQFSEYGDKYSGGLGTYTAKHIPMAVYAKEVHKTFFVYGGTRNPGERYLLAMASVYDRP